MALIEEDELEPYLGVIDEFSSSLEEATIVLLRRRRVFEQRRQEQNPPPSPPPNPNRYRLPNIPMPTFSGNYSKWMLFKSKFQTRIASSTELDDAEKLHYLRECLTVNARDMQAPNDTFTSLWQALQDRFDRKRIVLEIHLDELFNITKLRKESAKDLTNLLDVTLTNVRVLESLGLQQNDMSKQMFLHILCSRLDNETRKAFEMQLSPTEFPNYDDTIEFLQNRCHILESIEQGVSAEAKPTSSFKGTTKLRRFGRDVGPKTSTFVTSGNNISCPLCTKNHYINQCKRFLGLQPKDRLQQGV
jgi:Protein of unknown function (DUF1759)